MRNRKFLSEYDLFGPLVWSDGLIESWFLIGEWGDRIHHYSAIPNWLLQFLMSPYLDFLWTTRDVPASRLYCFGKLGLPSSRVDLLWLTLGATAMDCFFPPMLKRKFLYEGEDIFWGKWERRVVYRYYSDKTSPNQNPKDQICIALFMNFLS